MSEDASYISEGLKLNSKLVSSDYSIKLKDLIIFADGSLNLTLPTITNTIGTSYTKNKSVFILKALNSDCTVTVSGGLNIDNSSQYILKKNTTVFFYADSTNAGGPHYKTILDKKEDTYVFKYLSSQVANNEISLDGLPYGFDLIDVFFKNTFNDILLELHLDFKDAESTASDSNVKSNNISVWIELFNSLLNGTGTLQWLNGSTTITGISTSFTTQLSVGSVIFTSDNISRKVVSVDSNSSITVDTPMNTTNSSSFRYQTPVYIPTYIPSKTVLGNTPRYGDIMFSASLNGLITSIGHYFIRVLAKKSNNVEPVTIEDYTLKIT